MFCKMFVYLHNLNGASEIIRYTYLQCCLTLFLWEIFFFDGPLGQLEDTGWPNGPAEDIVKSRAVQELLCPMATTKLNIFYPTTAPPGNRLING